MMNIENSSQQSGKPVNRLLLDVESTFNGINSLNRQRHYSANPPASGVQDVKSLKQPLDGSLEKLSLELEQICRKPISASPRHSSPHCGNHTKLSLDVEPTHSRPISDYGCLRRNVLVMAQMGHAAATPESHRHIETVSPGSQIIRVRHQETEAKLKQSLTAICQVSSPPSPTAGTEPTAKKATSLRVKESLKLGVRLKIDITKIPAECLAVSISPDNILQVFRIGCADESSGDVNNSSAEQKTIIHTTKLTDACSVQALVCVVINESLYIRERSKEATVLEYSEFDFDGLTPTRFLPIVAEVESSMRFSVMLHVPTGFSSSDLNVRTVDDWLMIKGHSSSCKVTVEAEPGLAVSTTETASDCTEKGVWFSVLTRLPEGSLSRSVVAELTTQHQLIVRGKLNPASRRMTCAF